MADENKNSIKHDGIYYVISTQGEAGSKNKAAGYDIEATVCVSENSQLEKEIVEIPHQFDYTEEDVKWICSVIQVNDGAFTGNGCVKIVTIDEGVECLLGRCFSGCSLKQLTLPSTIDIRNKKKELAFLQETCVEAINFKQGKDCEFLRVKDGVLYYQNPKKNDNMALYCIHDDLKDCIIQEDTKAIASYAFYKHSLETLTLPSTLETINANAFVECENLKFIKINSENFIEAVDGALDGIDKNCIIYVSNPKFADDYRNDSNWSRFTKIISEIPKKFDEGNLHYDPVDFDKREACVGRNPNAKGGVVIKSVVEHEGICYNVRSIAARAFESADIETVTLPSSIEEIGDKAFLGCKLLKSFDSEGERFYAPQGVLIDRSTQTLIQYPMCKEEAFYELDANVETIGSYAFDGCDNLTQITVSQENPPIVLRGGLSGVDKSCIIMVPKGKIDDYKKADGWKEFNILDEEPKSFVEGQLTYKVVNFSEKTVEIIDQNVKGFITVPEVGSTVTHQKLTYTICEVGAVVCLPEFDEFDYNHFHYVVHDPEMKKVVVPKQEFKRTSNDPLALPKVNDKVSYKNFEFVVEKVEEIVVKLEFDKFDDKGLRYEVVDALNLKVRIPKQTINCETNEIQIPKVNSTVTHKKFEFLIENIDTVNILPSFKIFVENGLKYSVMDPVADMKVRLENQLVIEGTKVKEKGDKVSYNGFDFTVEEVGAITKVPQNFPVDGVYYKVHDLENKHVTLLSQKLVKGTKVPDIDENVVYQKIHFVVKKIETITWLPDFKDFVDVESGLKYSVIDPDGLKVKVVKSPNASGTITIPIKVNFHSMTFDVVGMEGNPFSDSKLNEIKVPKDHKYFKSEEGVLFSKDGKKIIAYPHLKADKTYSIPGVVTTMGNYSFGNGNLTKIVIPKTVNQLEPYALCSCGGLKTLEVQNTTPPKVGEKSFNGVPTDCIIIVPKNCVSKYKAAEGWKAFANSIYDDVPSTEFPSNNITYRIMSLDDRTVEVAQNPNASGAISIPSVVTYCGVSFNVVGIGDQAFNGNKKLTSVSLPNTIKYVGQVVFYGSGIKEIIVDANNKDYKSINGVLFSKDGKKIITYPNLKADETYTIPSGVTTMGSYSFENGNLTKIVIPNTLNQLESYALWSCRELKTLEVQSTTPPKVGEKSFNGVPTDCIIIVPKNCVSKYKAAEGWKALADRIVDEIPPEFSFNNIRYRVVSLDERTVEVAENPNASGAISIPSTVTYCGVSFNVVGIGDKAFLDNKNVKSISLPDTIKEIKYRAFDSSLISRISIPPYTEKIGGQAFFNMTIENAIEVPASVKEIAYHAFCNSNFNLKVHKDNKYYCAEDNVLFNKNKTELIYYMACKPLCDEYSVPNTVTKIGGTALQEAKIKHLRLPASLKAFEGVPFWSNQNIKTITILATTPPTVEKSDTFSRMSAIVIVPKNCVSKYKAAEGWKAFANRIIDDTNPEFPVGNINYKVLSLEDRTVEVIKSPDVSGALTIPQTVTHCGVSFMVTRIGTDAFRENGKISDITLPDAIKYIGDYAFKDVSSKKSITVPKSLEEVGYCAFYSSGLTFVNLDLPSGLKKIGGLAFDAVTVSTKRVTVPASVSSLGVGGMFRCGVEKIEVASGNANYKSVDGVLFSKNGDTLIEYPDVNTRKSYTVPSGVVTIYDRAFMRCKNLEMIILPGTINSIGVKAFRLSSSLALLDVKAITPPKLSSNSLDALNSKCIVRVPKGYVAKYKAAEGWKEIANRIVDDTNPEFPVGKINYKVLSLVDRTAEVAQNPNASGAITIPSQVAYSGDKYTVVGIGEKAFYGSKITSISLPNTIKSVGYYAFYGLKIPMSLPSSLEKVGMRAFRDNTFEDLSLPSGLKEIGRLAFEFATVKSQRATIRSSVTAIAGNVFYVSVKEIKVSDSNPAYKSINGVLFSKDGRKLTAYPYVKPDTVYSIPSGVTTIESDQIIASLTRLVIPASVNKLEDYALWSLYNLKTLELQGTTPPVVGDQSLHGVKSSCVIIVPKGCAAKYKAASGWKNFASQIREA